MAHRGVFLFVIGICVVHTGAISLRRKTAHDPKMCQDPTHNGKSEDGSDMKKEEACKARYTCNPDACWEEGIDVKECNLAYDQCVNSFHHLFHWFGCSATTLNTAKKLATNIINVFGSSAWLEKIGRSCNATSTDADVLAAQNTMSYECTRAYMVFVENIVDMFLQASRAYLWCKRLAIIRDAAKSPNETFDLTKKKWRDRSCTLGLLDFGAGMGYSVQDLLYSIDTCSFPRNQTMPNAEELAITFKTWMEGLIAGFRAIEGGGMVTAFSLVKRCATQWGLDFWNKEKPVSKADVLDRNVGALCGKYAFGVIEYSLEAAVSTLRAVSASKTSHDRDLICPSGILAFLQHWARTAKHGVHVFNEDCWTGSVKAKDEPTTFLEATTDRVGIGPSSKDSQEPTSVVKATADSLNTEPSSKNS